MAVFSVNAKVMENSFEDLIASYIENKVGISEHFLSVDLANNLKQNLIVLNQKSLLMEAGIGNSDKVSYDYVPTLFFPLKKAGNFKSTITNLKVENFVR